MLTSICLIRRVLQNEPGVETTFIQNEGSSNILGGPINANTNNCDDNFVVVCAENGLFSKYAFKGDRIDQHVSLKVYKGIGMIKGLRMSLSL